MADEANSYRCCCEQVFKLWVATLSCRDEAPISYVTSKNKQYMEIYMQITIDRNSPHPCMVIKILNFCYLEILLGRTDKYIF